MTSIYAHGCCCWFLQHCYEVPTFGRSCSVQPHSYVRRRTVNRCSLGETKLSWNQVLEAFAGGAWMPNILLFSKMALVACSQLAHEHCGVHTAKISSGWHTLAEKLFTCSTTAHRIEARGHSRPILNPTRCLCMTAMYSQTQLCCIPQAWLNHML